MSKLLYQKYFKQLSRNLINTTEDDYKRAIATLNLLQSNTDDLKSPQTSHFLEGKLNKLRSFLSLCGIEMQQLEEQLSVIHVSGTKGKGSTCAYCESILQNYGFKTGFFSSPHLVSVRERIRIDGQPISREKFADCFWNVHNKIDGQEKSRNMIVEMPPYFMFLTLMAFKIFLEEKVDVAIIEVGIGGEFDCTNILSNTAVVGISSLGFDHVKILGNTIELIASQKAGIMKPGCIAITSSNQPVAALKILREKAEEKKCDFFVAPLLRDYVLPDSGIELGIKGLAQEHNASLAVQLVNAWMNFQNYRGLSLDLSKEMVEGLVNCRWPGRTQLLTYSPNLAYYLDGAHTLESMTNCVLWYKNATPASEVSKKVLVFNMTGSRNPSPIMELFLSLKFDYVLFCSNRITVSNNDISQDNINLRTSMDEDYKRLVSYQNEWMQHSGLTDKASVRLFNDVLSVHKFLDVLSENEKLHVLVTGSLHLVGAILSIVDPDLRNSYKNNTSF